MSVIRFKNPGYVNYQVVNVKDLEKFDNGATVDVNSLIEKGLVAKKNLPVKILGDGELTKKLTIKVDKITKSAEEKIKKSGSTCEIKPSKAQATAKTAAPAEKPKSEEKNSTEEPEKA